MTISIMSNADILIEFGARVRAFRKELEWSQEDLAAHCGLDRTYVGGIERGERNVALRNLQKLAKGLGLSVSELLADL